jgi:hypothetical protein
METIDTLKRKFTQSTPIFISANNQMLKLEIKPYLQPFEIILALKELEALLGTEEVIKQEFGYYLVETDLEEDYLSNRLTYWQRLGRDSLVPSLQTSLEFTQSSYKKNSEQKELHNARRLRYGPHDLHEYRGKFFPQLVRSLINISGITDSGIIIDPMCGSGTTLCESLVTGRSSLGADLNPLSVLISKVKSQIVLESSSSFQEAIKNSLSQFRFDDCSLTDIWNSDDLKYLSLWFDKKALSEISAVLHAIDSMLLTNYKDFFKVCLSNIIRSVSWQKEEDLRVRKEIKPHIDGIVIEKFLDEVNKQNERIYSYLCILPSKKIKPEFLIRRGNSINISDLFSDYTGKLDLLITSPPYATALPYLDTDRLSLIILGLLPHKDRKIAECSMIGTREVSERQRREAWDYYLNRKSNLPKTVTDLIDFVAEHNHQEDIGFRRRNLPALLGKYYLDMLDAMKSAHKLMKPNASGFYIVGNNSTTINDQKIEIPTDRFLYEIGEVAGWKKLDFIPMELLASRDIFKENRGSAETILYFKA